MATRRIHVVRCKNPNDGGGSFVDVAVLDAIGLVTANGDELLFEVMDVNGYGSTDDDISADGGEERLYDHDVSNVVPYIIDNTGDGNGRGNPGDASRVSHMVRLTGETDATQFIDAEVLDAVVLSGPNGSEVALLMPQSKSSASIVDDTGSGLSVGANSFTTRALHVVKVVDKETPDPTKFVLVERTDQIAFEGPNGNEFLLTAPNDDDAFIDDTTVYGSDAHGNPVPPDNTDPNPYIVFPKGSKGPYLGKGVAVNQGLLWWIKNIGAVSSVWYFYFPEQQPFNWQEFGPEVDDVDQPAIWRLGPWAGTVTIPPDNLVPDPIASFGFPSLVAAVEGGTFGADYVKMDFLNAFLYQLVGVPQPKDSNNNPILPTPAVAQIVAQKFALDWNLTSDSYNSIMASINGQLVGNGTLPDAVAIQLATTFFDIPLPPGSTQTGLGGSPPEFSAGLPPGFFNSVMSALQFGSASYIKVDQLDPKLWNTSVDPPVLWNP